jgi:hypothetical protein
MAALVPWQASVKQVETIDLCSMLEDIEMCFL